MIWATVSLYLIGAYALHCMSRDLSDLPYSKRSIINLIFWPVTCAWACIMDSKDAILRLLNGQGAGG